MKLELSLTERLIVEELSVKPASFYELKEQTNFGNEVLLNSLHLLSAKNIVRAHKNHYSLNRSFVEQFKEDLTSYQNNIYELKELISSAIDFSVEHQKQDFGVHKVSLTRSELAVVKGLISEIDSVLKQAKKKSDHGQDKVLFYWGHGDYNQIIHHTLI